MAASVTYTAPSGVVSQSAFPNTSTEPSPTELMDGSWACIRIFETKSCACVCDSPDTATTAHTSTTSPRPDPRHAPSTESGVLRNRPWSHLTARRDEEGDRED